MKEHFHFLLHFQHQHRLEICSTFSFCEQQFFVRFTGILISGVYFGKMPSLGELNITEEASNPSPISQQLVVWSLIRPYIYPQLFRVDIHQSTYIC